MTPEQIIQQLKNNVINKYKINDYHYICYSGYSDSFDLYDKIGSRIKTDINEWMITLILKYNNVFFDSYGYCIFDSEDSSIAYDELKGMCLAVDKIDELIDLKKIFLHKKIKDYVSNEEL